MAGNKIERQLGRMETLVKKGEKVPELAGKEKELAETYIYKVHEFLDDLKSLHPRERERMKKPLFEALKGIDEENMLSAKEKFDSKIDAWSEMVDKKVERRNRFFNIEYKGWIDLVPKRMFDDVYESFVKKGIELKESGLDKFEEYVDKTGKIAERYREAMAYFFDDARPTAIDNVVMKLYMSQAMVEGILTGKIESPRSLVTAFEQQTKEIEEKVEKCEGFALSLDKFAVKSGPVMQDLVADRNIVIHMYEILIERGGMTLGTIEKVMRRLTSSEEFKSMAEEGWSNADEMKQFLMEAVLRGGMKEGEPNKIDNREIKKLRAELYAEQLFRREQVRLSQKLEEYSRILKDKREEMVLYKKEFTDEKGFFYTNMLLESARVTRTEGVEKEVKRGNFKKFVGMERRAAEASVAGIAVRINMMRNSAKLSMAMNAIHEMANPDSLEDMKSMVKTVFERIGDEGLKLSYERVKADFCTEGLLGQTGQFSEVERLRAEYYVAKNEFAEKEALLKHENLLKGEFMYRQSLEGGEKVDNEKVKNAVLARKETKILDITRSINELEESLERETAFIENAIDMYGSIHLVPEGVRESYSNKSKTLLSLLGSSMKFISKMQSLDLEIKLLDPEKGLDKNMKKDLEDDYEIQKDLFFKTSEFLNNKFRLPDANIASAEAQKLMLGNLKERVESNVGTAVDKLADKSRDAGFFFKKQLESKVMGKMGITQVDVLNIGIGKMKDMEEAIVSGRKNLQSAKEDLLGMLSVRSGLFKEHPELVETRNKLINKLVGGIDNLLRSQFSYSQQIEAIKVRTQLQEAKEDMFWNVVKMGVVFALSVAAAMATGGLASAGAGRLCALCNIGGRATSVIRFTAGNIGVAAGSTVGQRLAMHATDILPGSSWGDRVDWSGGALAKDFGVGFGLSMAFSGGGAVIGKKLGAHTLKKTGFSYSELSEAGITKLGFLQKIGEKVYGFKPGAPTRTAGLLSRIKGVSTEFLNEVTQEGLEEMGDAIHPAVGGIFALANAASGVSTEVEVSTEVSAKLHDIGVEFNKDTGRLEFFHSNAKDFGIDLLNNLGEAGQQVDCSVNEDGTFSLKVKGTDEEVLIHPSQKMEEEKEFEAEVKEEVVPDDMGYISFAEKMRKSWNGLVDRLSRAGKAFDEAFMQDAGAVSAFGAGALGGMFKGIGRGVKEIVKGRKEKVKLPKPFDDIDIQNEVYVRRSDGTIEKGWLVVAKREDNVTVYNPEKKSTKIVKGDKLWKLDVLEKRGNLDELPTLTKVYVKRKGNRLERGWNVVTDNPDGTYVLTNDRGTFIKRNVKREDIYRPEEVEENTYEERFFKEKVRFGEIDPSENIKTPNRNTEKLPFKEVYRKNDIVALPDLHGDFDAFQNTLRDHNLINENGEWIGGDKRIQILGDIFDRGPHGVKILEKIIEYKKKGAQIDFIMGNHESFVLPALLGDDTGMYRWIINEKSGSIPKVTEAFQENPELFEMFKSSKLLEQVDDILYMHAELSDQAATLIEKYGIDGINRSWQKMVSRALEGDLDSLNNSLGEFFPLLWSRAITRKKYATAENKQRISHILKERGINLVVHGHSPFDYAKGYKVGDVKVLDIDVRMSSDMNDEGKSRTGGLEIKKKGELEIHNPKGKRKKVVNM